MLCRARIDRGGASAIRVGIEVMLVQLARKEVRQLAKYLLIPLDDELKDDAEFAMQHMHTRRE